MSACVVTTVMDLDDRRHFPAAWPERDHVLTLNRQQMAPKALLPYTLETRSKTRAIGLVANDRVQLFNPLPANGSSSWASPAADHGLHQTGLNERRGNPPLLGETSLPREAAEHQVSKPGRELLVGHGNFGAVHAAHGAWRCLMHGCKMHGPLTCPMHGFVKCPMHRTLTCPMHVARKYTRL